MKKLYTLDHFGGNRFALVVEEEQDAMTDYFPGIWGIETQKRAVEECRELLEQGHAITAGIGDAQKISKILKRL